jgi:hypothetical protein
MTATTEAEKATEAMIQVNCGCNNVQKFQPLVKLNCDAGLVHTNPIKSNISHKKQKEAKVDILHWAAWFSPLQP